MNIEQIIEAAGGAEAIAKRRRIMTVAVEQWAKRGVPLAHWNFLSEASGVSIEAIFRATMKVKRAA